LNADWGLTRRGFKERSRRPSLGSGTRDFPPVILLPADARQADAKTARHQSRRFVQNNFARCGPRAAALRIS